MVIMGIDLHSDSFYVARARPYKGGIIRTEKKYGLDEKSLELFKESLSKDDYILIEISTNSFWFRDQVQPYVKECYILDLNAVKYSGNKTDKIDGVPRRPPFLWVRDPPWQLPVQPCSEECMERGNPGP